MQPSIQSLTLECSLTSLHNCVAAQHAFRGGAHDRAEMPNRARNTTE